MTLTIHGRRVPAWALAGVLALILALALSACGSSSSSKAAADKASAKAAASSAMAQPQVSSDLNTTEQLLLTNFQAAYKAEPAHPFKAAGAALRKTFPQGDTAKIAQYGVSTFTLGVVHTSGPGSARDKWLQGVFTYATTQGGATPAVPVPASPPVTLTPTATFSTTGG